MRKLSAQLALLVSYVFLAWLTLRTYSLTGLVSVLWPGSGLALAALLLGGKAFRPVIFLSALISEFWLAEHHLGEAVLLAGGFLLESQLAVWLLQRNPSFSPELHNNHSFMTLLRASLLAPLLGASVGATCLWLDQDVARQDYGLTLLHWWMGDSLGMLLVTASLLVWHQPFANWRQPVRHRALWPTLALSLLAGQIIFLDRWQHWFGVIDGGYWIFLLVAFAAIKLGRHGVLLVIWLTLLHALFGAATERGFFAYDLQHSSLVNLWAYFYIVTLLGLGISIALRESRHRAEHARAMINSMPDGVLLFDVHGQLIKSNAAARKALGMTLNNVPQSQLTQENPALRADGSPFPPDELPLTLALAGQSSHGVIVGEHLPDGTLRWKRVNAAPLYDSNHQHINGAVLSFSDVTAQRQAEQARQLSEQRFADIVTASADWIWEVDAQARYTYVSDNVQTMLGYAPADMLGKTPFDFMPAEEAARLVEVFQRIAQQKQPFRDLENVNLRPDGSRCIVSTNGVPIFNSQGQLTGYRGMDRDISAQVEMLQRVQNSEKRLRQALDATNEGVWDWDLQNDIAYLSPHYYEMIGYRPEAVHPNAAFFQSLLHPEDRMLVLATMQAHLQGKTALSEFECRMQRQDGSWFWVGGKGRVTTRDATGQPLRMVGTIADISERRQMEEQLRRLSQIVEQSSESVEVTDLQANIEYVNEAFVRTSGYPRDELLGRNPKFLGSGKNPPGLYADLWQTLLRGEVWQGELINRHKNGAEYIERAVISPLRQPDGRISHYVAIKRDISAQKAAEAQIHRLAYYDPLTGLPNRTSLLEKIQQRLQQPQAALAALLLLNLDRFKNVNDAAGPQLGDRLLQAVAERLQNVSIAHPLLVTHLAGDEFCLLFPTLDNDDHAASAQMNQVADSLHACLQQPFGLNGEQFRLSACLGITLFPTGLSDTSLDILRRANTALHHSKQRGHGQSTFFNLELDRLSRQRFNLENDLRQGIAHGQLRLYLQSQVNAVGEVVGAESLVRWQHPTRGLVPPGDFIPVAEESDLIVEIGNWMLHAVCQLLARAELQGRPLRIAVNISPRQFRQNSFISHLQQALHTSAARPERLTLEITEGMVLDDVDSMIERMRQLSALGIHFSMDDFGTGYSSLSYLKRLPINELKIDKSFVQDVTHDPNDAALVEVILSVARHMGLSVVAEGVETQEQADFLNRHGTVIHQGYLYARPVPAEEWLAGFGSHSAKP